jgi:hypothetical protein
VPPRPARRSRRGVSASPYNEKTPEPRGPGVLVKRSALDYFLGAAAGFAAAPPAPFITRLPVSSIDV